MYLITSEMNRSRLVLSDKHQYGSLRKQIKIISQRIVGKISCVVSSPASWNGRSKPEVKRNRKRDVGGCKRAAHNAPRPPVDPDSNGWRRSWRRPNRHQAGTRARPGRPGPAPRPEQGRTDRTDRTGPNQDHRRLRTLLHRHGTDGQASWLG